ncbi:MAG: ferredoxin reductase [Actinomycetota bacterium]|nr:ferredoxin reductase [Actinomycetota bacterium]
MRWLVGTVAETVPETVTGVTIRLDVPDWPGHRAGQHVDVRLTAEDGYSAQRSYSIASAPGAERLGLTVVREDDGEVSPYLTTVLDVGDQLELRGPIGGYFVWEPVDARPVLLVGGGSGVVPLMAMLRHHEISGSQADMRLVYSARTVDDLLYRDELLVLADSPHRDVTITLTRDRADRWAGRLGRVDRALLDTAGWPPSAGPRCYVAGPTPFVEEVADALVALGHRPGDVKTERFGPTGG